MLALQPRYSNYTLSSGILLKTKEVGVLEWFLLAALVVSGLVYEYRMHSLTKNRNSRKRILCSQILTGT